MNVIHMHLVKHIRKELLCYGLTKISYTIIA